MKQATENAQSQAVAAGDGQQARPDEIVQVTPGALNEIRRLRDKRGMDQIVLRVGVKGGGCAGLTYSLNFDTRITENDHVLDHDDVKLVVDRKSAVFLRGMTLDYSDDLIGGGFRFENPNARKSCSCGTSFSV